MLIYYSFVFLLLLLPFEICSFNFPNISKSFSSKFYNNSISSRKTLPLVIAHRGDCARMPDNTIPAFTLAFSEAVDFIEPDLVLTKDHVFVCYHDLTLASGTDVRTRAEFAHLRIVERNVTYDNQVETIRDDWLVSDFTLKQLKSLRIVRHNQTWSLTVPTFDEFIESVGKLTWKSVYVEKNYQHVVGIMPELKHPSYFNAINNAPHFMEKLFIEKLKNYGYSVKHENCDEEEMCRRCEYKPTSDIIPCNPLIIQSWEQETIDFFNEAASSLGLLRVLWTNNAEYLTWSGMAMLAGKVEFVGLPKEFLVKGAKAEIEKANVSYDQGLVERLGGFIPAERLVDYVQQLGIKVAVYTITPLAKNEELEYFFRLGVQAFFVEGLENTIEIINDYFIRRNVC